MNDKFYTAPELAELFGVTTQTIYNWVEKGRFPNRIRAGERGIVVIPAADVEKVRQEEADKLVAGLRRLGFQPVSA